MNTPSFKPLCPNHAVPLEGCGFPLPAKGVGICPVSQCPFEFEASVDEEKMVLGKDGKMHKEVSWKVMGHD